MGLYNVVQPCVIVSGGKAVHHVRPTSQPIEVDDEVAAELVESGQLKEYRPGGVPGKTGTPLDAIAPGAGAAAERAKENIAKVIESAEVDPKPRRGKASSES